MKRLASCALALAAVAALLASGASSAEAPRYRIVLDNAFGLTEGADLRAAGVRVGSVSNLDVDARTARAIATVEIEDQSFGAFRSDVFCRIQPQSLIGEYFIDCQPGTKPERLRQGATIPVEQTAGTVPPDLVQSVMRRPYRERLGILLAELGAGFAARGEDVNAAIARAIPALEQTDRVLKILHSERRTLRALTRDADTVLARLAAGRGDVARFVKEAGETAAASADRRDDLATTFNRLPAFLRGLRPTLRDLGLVARRQTPALRDLRVAAPALETLFRRLGPFSNAALPAITSLGDASVIGRRAARTARPTVRRLRELGESAPEPTTNLRFVLEHLDDRSFAVEPNPISPGGKGFTGLEAALQYPFTQSQAVNIFDVRGYILKINALINECSQYTNADGALRNPERTKRCSAALGNGAPPFEPSTQPAGDRTSAGEAPSATTPAANTPAPATAPLVPEQKIPLPSVRVPEIRLPGLPPIKLPPLLGGGRERAPGTDASLLDFLLGS